MTSVITLNEITKHIKFNKNNISINLNVDSEYEQPTKIPLRIENPNCDLVLDTSVKEVDNNVLKYEYNEIINLPNTFSEFLDLNNYYSYGVNKDNSFIQSFMYVYDNDYKLDNDNNKLIKINDFKNKLQEEINNPNYKCSKKRQLLEELDNDNYTSHLVISKIGELFKLNLVILDLNEKTSILSDTNINEEYTNIIILKSGSIYYPLIHMYGYQLDYPTLIKLVKTYSK